MSRPDYQQHEDDQRRAWASLPPVERLRWLQQAKLFASKWLGAASKPAAPPREPPSKAEAEHPK